MKPNVSHSQIHVQETAEDSIFIAAKLGNLTAIQTHIDKNPHIINQHSPTGFHNTPLHMAKLYNQEDAYNLLVANGADTTIKNTQGLTPEQIHSPYAKTTWGLRKQPRKVQNTTSSSDQNEDDCLYGCFSFLRFWQINPAEVQPPKRLSSKSPQSDAKETDALLNDSNTKQSYTEGPMLKRGKSVRIEVDEENSYLNSSPSAS